MVVAKRPFYAMEDNRIPMYLGFFTVAINIALSIMLSKIFGIFGITIATSISFFIGDIVLLWLMKRKIQGLNWNGIFSFIVRILIAGMVSAGGVWAIDRIWKLSGFLNFFVATVSCFAFYLAVLILLKTREIIQIWKVLKQKVIYKGN